jgi:catechol 2,3-dioxygenase-like lactoylglutathione lyase family enzyme
MVTGSFADLCVDDVDRSVAFYRALLQLDVLVDHGWYAELGIDGRTFLAVVERDHETIPAVSGGPPRGVLVSFEVDNAEAVARQAVRMAAPILVELVTELGQRHVMVQDPDGAVVDVIERVPLSGLDVRRLVTLRRAMRSRR